MADLAVEGDGPAIDIDPIEIGDRWARSELHLLPDGEVGVRYVQTTFAGAPQLGLFEAPLLAKGRRSHDGRPLHRRSVDGKLALYPESTAWRSAREQAAVLIARPDLTRLAGARSKLHGALAGKVGER